MSGDVQPRKRKDKRKKKEGGSLGMMHEPVSSHKHRSEGEDRKAFDLPEQGEKIHVQNEHGVGGNICVKIIFFCLLGLLVGAVGLIYMKSQGSSDVDLPTIEESRFADYFTGWLDDNTEEHEHETIKNEVHDDHSHDDNEELDDQEDLEMDEENGNEEEDQNIEQNSIFNIFGGENAESEEVHKSSTILNEATERDDSEMEKEVNESDNDEESPKIIEEEKYEDGSDENFDSDELEEQINDRDENEISDEDMHTNNNYDSQDSDLNEIYESNNIREKKIYGVENKVGNENNDEQDDIENDDEQDDIDNKEELSNENDSEEEEKKRESYKDDDDDVSVEEINISEDDLDDTEFESIEDLMDEFKEKTNSFMEENEEEKSKDIESEILEGEEEIIIDTRGVTIKLGVGIALIIIAHLVLVQKWKSVSNAASDGVYNQDVEESSSQEELSESTPIPPPRAHRDGRGAQYVDEDPIKHFESIGESEESQDYSKAGDETIRSQHAEAENQKTQGKNADKDEWSYRQELEFADEQFENNPKAAVEAYGKVIAKKPTHVRALIGHARALDHWAEKEKSNKYLKQAIDAYKTLLLNNGDLLDDETYVKLAERCIERMRFAGALISAIEVHKALIRKYPGTPKYRNMLAVTYLMMNKIPQARVLLNETLSMWPENGFALVHYGFILKTSDDNMEEGAKKLMAGIQTREEGVINGMFFFHLGDALHRLGRSKEAMEWYELGVKEGLFLSKYQRSLYNVDRLKGQPWWTKEDTTYQEFFKKLENNWREIRREGLELLNSKGVNLFKEEAENLKDTGDWKQLDLYFRGKKTPSCNKAPVTCSLVSSFQPAATCTRGQIKFSVMLPNTHVWPHCGPTNCRLRSHLGLVVPKHTFIRVAEETRSWEEGKFIIFDDSFEHEVWHNGTGPRLVLIVDVWHPELTNHERRQLSPI